MMESRTFDSAVAFLMSRSRLARPKTCIDYDLPARTLPSKASLRGKPPLFGMKEWLQRLGHSTAKLDSLNVIHVAGTKGKGSTCAYIESFLRAQGKATSFPCRTGLYTSPHLEQVNERIRINFKPLEQARFAEYVFEVRDGLSIGPGSADGPRYLQLLALISFHAFLREGVEVAIYETHHGGEYDPTNVVEHPVVTAITSIGMDHVVDLGPTLENIAWHKGGILKTGAAAFCAPQDPAVLEVLRSRASAADVVLDVIDPDPELPGEFASHVQRLNCSLARAVSNEFLMRRAPEGHPRRLSHQAVLDGIRQFNWPGRFQIIQDGSFTWFLDGAHNELSITQAARWFQAASNQSTSGSSPCRILVFAQNSTARDAEGVIKQLAESLEAPIDHIVFTTYAEHQDKISDDDIALLQRFGEIWRHRRASTPNVFIAASVSEALDIAREKGATQSTTHVLLTGSLYLVGASLRLGLSTRRHEP